jgi:Hypervirulence associated proteins TUDOR domain
MRERAWIAAITHGGARVTNSFKVGDHVTWNSEAGHVTGTIIRVHLKNIEYKGYTHHATPNDPQYEIKSDKSDHIALHKSSALKLVRR